jgi:hypothetical protein
MTMIQNEEQNSPLDKRYVCSICLTTDRAGSTSSPLILVYNKQNGRARDVVLH